MQSTKQQLFIVKNRTEKFIWGCYQGDTVDSVNILYDGQNEKFKFTLPEASSEDNRLRDIASSVQLSFQERQCSIEFITTYNKSSTCATNKLRMSPEPALIKELSNFGFVEPMISVAALIGKKASFLAEISLSELDNVKAGDKFETAIQPIKQSEYDGISWVSFTYSIVLEWTKTKKNQCNILEKLLDDKLLADCCILTAENSEIKCHSNILAVNSDVFHAMLTSGLKESQSKRIELTDLSDTVVNELITYLYGQEIKTSQMQQDTAFDLLRAAHKYNIVSLERDMTDVLLNQPDTSYEMNILLAVYFFTVNIEEFHVLYKRVLDIMRRNPDDLVSSSSYQDLLENDPKEAAILALKLLKLGSH